VFAYICKYSVFLRPSVYKIQCNFESGSVKFSVILKTHLATLKETHVIWITNLVWGKYIKVLIWKKGLILHQLLWKFFNNWKFFNMFMFNYDAAMQMPVFTIRLSKICRQSDWTCIVIFFFQIKKLMRIRFQSAFHHVAKTKVRCVINKFFYYLFTSQI